MRARTRIRTANRPHFSALLAVALLLAAMNARAAGAEELGLAQFERIPLTGCLKLSADGKGCAEPLTLSPSRTAWAEMQSRLDPRARIPVPGPAQLSYTTGKLRRKTVRTMDLSAEVPRWLSLRFQDPAFGASEEWVRSVGNLLATFRDTRGDAARQKQLLGRLQQDFPRVWDQVRGFLPEWVRDDFLHSEAWNPSKTGSPQEDDNDGILERPPFLLAAANAEEPDGDGAAGGRRIYQACAPIYAPWEALFATENDFRNYHIQAGSNYLDVYPLQGSYFSGLDGSGRPFLLYDVSFHQRPLPLWNLKFVLRQFVHQEQGRWQMENRLLEGNMNHLRLRIFYDPILTTRGETIGCVKTEWIDLDVKGLPDGDADRQTGARGDVGNIKRVAERAARSP